MIETQVKETVHIDETGIYDTLLFHQTPSVIRVREVLSKAAEMKGLDSEEAAVLMSIENPELLDELFRTAREVKETIYGKIFCDSGIVEEGPYRVTIGFGLELVVPQLFQMIPMHFDFGFPVISDDLDDEEVFSFSFGMTF